MSLLLLLRGHSAGTIPDIPGCICGTLTAPMIDLTHTAPTIAVTFRAATITIEFPEDCC